MTTEPASTPNGRQTDHCSVVILYETGQSLTRALRLCEELMVQFWEDQDIHLAHWPLEALTEEARGEEAAGRAAAADILVIAACGKGAVPRGFALWSERWLEQRRNREGALVGLLAPETEEKNDSREWDIQLHQLALRAGMDYLNHLPQTPPHGIPDIAEWCASRAGTRTATLDEIIRNEPRTTAS